MKKGFPSEKFLVNMSRWLALVTLFVSGGIVLMVSSGKDIHAEVFFYWCLVCLRYWAIWAKEHIYRKEDKDDEQDDRK